MVDAAVVNLAEDIYEITEPMYAATDAEGGLSPMPSYRRALIEEILGYALKDRLCHESGRIVFEPDEESPDITVYFKVGTIRGAPSFDV